MSELGLLGLRDGLIHEGGPFRVRQRVTQGHAVMAYAKQVIVFT